MRCGARALFTCGEHPNPLPGAYYTGAYYKGINVLAFLLVRGLLQNRELCVGHQYFGGASGIWTAISSRIFS